MSALQREAIGEFWMGDQERMQRSVDVDVNEADLRVGGGHYWGYGRDALGCAGEKNGGGDVGWQSRNGTIFK